MAGNGRSVGRPTLETVAARAGVSRSLVSLVLRDSPKVSAASREVVLAAVAELGYRPNATARRLAERRSHSVGVLLNDLRQPWFADLLDGLGPALHGAGKHLLLGDGRIDRQMDEALTWSFLETGVDGFVVAGSVTPSAAIIDVAGRLPSIALGGLDLDLPELLPHVDVLAADDHAGARLAVRHLRELGHGRIAHVSGGDGRAATDRAESYVATMRAAGLGAEIVVEDGDLTEEGGFRAAVRLLRRPAPPTAIFAANDLSGIGALSAAAELGVRVPDELSIVGFDNSALARLRALWLTSVDGRANEMGRQGARMLLHRIDHPAAAREVRLLEPRLVVRGSSGPVPA